MMSILKQCKGGTLHLIKIPKEYRVRVAKTAERALAEAGKLFAYQKPVEVIILPSIPDLIIPEIGLGAITDMHGIITVTIDFLRENIRKILQQQLQPTLHHEFVHAIRLELFGNSLESLLDDLANEGIASYVEKKRFRNKVLYIEPIKNEIQYWRQAKKILRKKKYTYEDHSKWFFGTKKLPRWIGYRLGYLLVDSFMKRQKISLSQLVRTKSREILRGAKDIYALTS